MATATFQDSYFKAAAVELRRVGRGDRWVWTGVAACVTAGYKPVPYARAIAYAMRDQRFSDVQEA